MASGTLFGATAKPTASGGAVTYDYATNGNPGSIGATPIIDGAVTLAAGKSLDYEGGTNPLVFVIV